MENPLIAIVGDISKTNVPAAARTAAEELGRELAKRGCRILVYGNAPTFLEPHVVKGYLESGAKIKDEAIEVRYPIDMEGLFPGEKAGDARFLRKPLGREWEVTFYPSLASADGLLLVGGGYTAKVAGLIAVGAGIPILALATFGGSIQDVWDNLRGDRHNKASEEELNLMTQPWSPVSAAKCIDALLNQWTRRVTEVADLESQTAERRRRRTLTFLALAGSIIFVGVLIALAQMWPSDKVSRTFLMALFGIPAFAGASGAAIRVVYDSWRQNAVPLELRPVVMTIALGFWASGVASALFILAQIVAINSLESSQAAKLFPLAIVIGLLAGLTLDKVFPKLLKMDVPVRTDVLGQKTVPAKPSKQAATAP